MNPRKLVAGLVGAAAITTMAISTPTASAAAPSIVAIVAASSPEPGVTDNNGKDFDILYWAVDALGLTDAVAGLPAGTTVFAPADNSFRGLVADLTNTPIWQLNEAKVKEILEGIAGTADLNGTGISGATALTQTVLYHVGARQPNGSFQMLNTVGKTTIEPKRFFFTQILRDGDTSDLDPFTVGRVEASNGTVFPIAGVLRPLDLKALFPLD